MSDLQKILAGGDLEVAVADGIAAVKAKPTDTESRYRLFALLAFSGDLHRARKQLEALGVGDEQLMRVRAVYINLLAAEQERRAVFGHEADPLLPPDPPLHLQLRLDALKAVRSEDFSAASAKIDAAISEQPDLQGEINGASLVALRDLDDLLGSVLEVFAGGRYMWLPLERIRRLEIAAPRHMLDLLWLPVELTDIHDTTSSLHIPALYVGSHEADDPRARTGAVTDFVDSGDGILRGRGQRLLAFADAKSEMQDLPVLELRSLTLGDDN